MTPLEQTVAIIQARMSSSRLPGKVLLPLAGVPVLAHVVRRMQASRSVGRVVVATSTDPSDDAIELWCAGAKVACYRGSLHDVLDRYVQAARAYNAEVIVRITGDCPAIDPTVVDAVIRAFIDGDYDCYGLAGEFPDGLDCTVFKRSALERAWREATLQSEREHVAPYIEKRPEMFKTGGLKVFQGLSHHRWTLDEPRDLEFLQAVFTQLHRDGPPFLAHDILRLLEEQPALAGINRDIVRNEGYLKSLSQDRSPNVQS